MKGYLRPFQRIVRLYRDSNFAGKNVVLYYRQDNYLEVHSLSVRNWSCITVSTMSALITSKNFCITV